MFKYFEVFMMVFGVVSALSGLVLLCMGYDYERGAFLLLNGLIMTKQDRKIE